MTPEERIEALRKAIESAIKTLGWIGPESAVEGVASVADALREALGDDDARALGLLRS